MATLAYFTVPKLLDTDEKFKHLSVEARYLYANMRDTLKLSIKNNWQDQHGFFIKMKRTTMADLLNKSVPTVRKIVKELIGAGLINERRVGLTQANRFYIQLLPGESELDFAPQKKAEVQTGEKPGFSPDGKAFSPNNRNLDIRHTNNPHNIEPTEKNNGRKDWKWFITEGSKWFDNKTGHYWQMVEGEIHPLVFGEELKERAAGLLCQLGLPVEEAARLVY